MAVAASVLALGCSHFRAPDDNRGPYTFANRTHPCAGVPPTSPLAPLQSKAIDSGCIEDVRLRPGPTPEADVRFSCPASPTPMIILRGHGHTPYRPEADPHEARRVYDATLTLSPAFTVHDVSFYGPRDAAPPPCTTEARGLTMSIYGYDVIDRTVDGLRKWIQKHDLDVELVIWLVPEPPPPVYQRTSYPD